jgi:hypothetical protein
VFALSGLPNHPLIVHIPVVLIPLAALAVWALAVRPAWIERYRWLTVIVTTLGFVGAVLAAANGEELEDQLRESGTVSSGTRRLIHDHADAGESARLFAFLFFVAVVLWLIGLWFAARKRWTQRLPSWLRPALMALAVLTSVGAVYGVIAAGHSGAKAAWCELSADGCD